MFAFLRHKRNGLMDPALATKEDVRIEFPGIRIAFNHRLKIAIIYDLDSSMPDNRYSDLENHLVQQGYFLQVVVAAVGMTDLPVTTFENGKR